MTATKSDGFEQPQPVTNVQLAFGADLAGLLPDYAAIPEDFRRERGDARPWIELQQKWMFEGLSKKAVTVKHGIDETAAWRHLKTLQSSWEPKHEHKEAAVAWLMSRWFELAA